MSKSQSLTRKYRPRPYKGHGTERRFFSVWMRKSAERKFRGRTSRAELDRIAQERAAQNAATRKRSIEFGIRAA